MQRRLRGIAGELQSAVHGIPERRSKVTPDFIRQPWLDRRCEAPDQTHPIDAERDEPSCQRIDMCARETAQFDRDRIIGRCALGDRRGEFGEVAWKCTRHPAHDRMRIRPESGKQRLEEVRPLNPTVVSPQSGGATPRTEPGAASFIGNGPTPAANPVLPSPQLGPADGSGADHDDAAVMSALGADARRLGIGDDNGRTKGCVCLRAASRWLGSLAPANARQATTLSMSRGMHGAGLSQGGRDTCGHHRRHAVRGVLRRYYFAAPFQWPDVLEPTRMGGRSPAWQHWA